MTLSTAVSDALDRGTLIVSVVAIIMLLGSLIGETVGAENGALWATSIIGVGFVGARLFSRMKRRRHRWNTSNQTIPDTIDGRWTWYVREAQRRQRLPHWEWEREDEFVIAAAQRAELRRLLISIGNHSGVTFHRSAAEARFDSGAAEMTLLEAHGSSEEIPHVHCIGDHGYAVYVYTVDRCARERLKDPADYQRPLGRVLDAAEAVELVINHLPSDLR